MNENEKMDWFDIDARKERSVTEVMKLNAEVDLQDMTEVMMRSHEAENVDDRKELR